MNDKAALLAELAADAACAVSDLFDEERYDWFLSLPPLRQIVWRYCHADCDDFAATLNAITGWPVLSLGSRIGPVHRLITAPDGRWLDAGGWTDLAQLKKRYRLRSLDVLPGLEAYGPIDDATSDVLPVLAVLEADPYRTPAFRDLVEAYLKQSAASPCLPAAG